MANYTNLNSVKIGMGIALNNEAQDARLTQAIGQATAVINGWLGRDLTRRTYTEVLKGNGQQYLPLTNRPVYLQKQTCTLNGTTTVTVEDGAKLVVGMPVSGTSPTPAADPSSPAITPGTTVTSVSANTVTLSEAATVSGPQTLYFGCQVWADQGAVWGSSSGAFGNATALTPGADYALDVDFDGQSPSGLLFCVNSFWQMPWNYNPGLITPVLGPPVGNIKVTYTAGYSPIPAKVELAANLLVARIVQMGTYGGQMQAESVSDYSYTLATPASATGLVNPEIANLLAEYRNVAV